MKKKKIIALLILAATLSIGCVKQKNCEDTRDGTLFVLEKNLVKSHDGNKVYAYFYPNLSPSDIDSIDFLADGYLDSSTYHFFVVNKLPKKYTEDDAFPVSISYIQKNGYTPCITITCIEDN
ncbi:hypothetical protein LJC53_07475 [Bacteroidales bacterium OttesenSCG-928-C03]|nr:hypothetical protein [Bacteroidales bacterium OttesenSCG-928-C03]